MVAIFFNKVLMMLNFVASYRSRVGRLHHHRTIARLQVDYYTSQLGLYFLLRLQSQNCASIKCKNKKYSIQHDRRRRKSYNQRAINNRWKGLVIQVSQCYYILCEEEGKGGGGR